jgi:hypothetical protein
MRKTLPLMLGTLASCVLLLAGCHAAPGAQEQEPATTATAASAAANAKVSPYAGFNRSRLQEAAVATASAPRATSQAGPARRPPRRVAVPGANQ